MAIDYVRMTALADRLIKANGRSVTFIRPSEVPADASKPWNPPIASETPLILNCVFVPPASVRIFDLAALGRATEFTSDLLTFSEQIGIVYPDGNDLRPYTFVEDQNVRWSIFAIQELMPGATRVLAFIGLRR